MKRNATGGTALAAVVVLFAISTPADADGPPARPKVLLEFGWDEPDTGFMRRHIAKMETTPFDGCVYHADALLADGKPDSLCWKFWGSRAFTEQELSKAVDDLRATPFRRFRHNFLRVNTAPADLDWFDDLAPVLANARLAARVAREGKSRGILLDVEQYQGQLFHYKKQKHAASRSWDEYAAQAKRQGHALMDAFQEAFPGLTVLLTFGPSLVAKQTQGGKVAVEETEYGLLAPFLEGMAEACRDGATIVDGYEPSYSYKKESQFDEGLKLMRSARPAVKAGFGLWLDDDWRKHGWNVDDPSRNPFTPEGFGAAVRAALERSDEIVWVYSETPRWWSPGDASPVKLPPAYIDALRRARQGLTAGEQPVP
ncbi:MAG: hypothetical protein U0835_11625 [Isosphaeraceae bacterium]